MALIDVKKVDEKVDAEQTDEFVITHQQEVSVSRAALLKERAVMVKKIADIDQVLDNVNVMVANEAGAKADAAYKLAHPEEFLPK